MTDEFVLQVDLIVNATSVAQVGEVAQAFGFAAYGEAYADLPAALPVDTERVEIVFWPEYRRLPAMVIGKNGRAGYPAKYEYGLIVATRGSSGTARLRVYAPDHLWPDVPMKMADRAGNETGKETFHGLESEWLRFVDDLKKSGMVKDEVEETAVPSQVSGEVEEVVETAVPWLNIPDAGRDRRVVEMLHAGYTDPEIADAFRIDSKTISNRLSSLRKQYPEYVPTRAQLQKKKRKLG